LCLKLSEWVRSQVPKYGGSRRCILESKSHCRLPGSFLASALLERSVVQLTAYLEVGGSRFWGPPYMTSRSEGGGGSEGV
jgi:hypothetical protein